MSHQYQPTSYYDWPARTHGLYLDAGTYQYVPYDYYAGDELCIRNTVFRNQEYVTYDNTHIRFLNQSDIHVYDTSSIKIFDSGTLTMYTSATTGTLPGSARKFIVDEFGRVGIGINHLGPHSNNGEMPSFDLDVKGQVGVEDYIYHNDDVDTYMLFGSDLSAHNVNTIGDTNTILPTDWNEINFRVGGIDMIQLQTRDVDYPESGVLAVGTQDHITFNKYQTDVDLVVRSATNTGAIVVSGDGLEVVINEDGNADTDFRIESDHEDHMFYLDTSVNRISIGDGGKDAPTATLEITNHPTAGAYNVPLVQLNSKDTDKIALDINADNIDADVIDITADAATSANVIDITADVLTTGSILNATTTSGSTAACSLLNIASTGNRGHSTNAVVVLDIDFDTTAGAAARVLRIDTEQTDSIVAEIDANRITTGTVLDIAANDLNSGKGLNMLFGSRTTGTGLHIKDTHGSDSAGALVKIEQTGNRDGSAASIGIDVNFDTTDNVNARTLRIDSEQTDGVVVELDATEITSGKALAIDADKLTTGKGIELLMDTRTTGTGLHIHDDSTSDSAGALVKIEQAGSRAGSAASIGIDLNFDTVANTAARALRIDSEQTDGVVVEIDATPLTTGKGIHLHTDNRTTGTGLHIHDASTSNSAGALVLIEQVGNRAGAAASIGVDINFDTVAAANARALRIDSEQTTGDIVEIDGDKLTTGTALDISNVDDLTSGSIVNLHSNSGSTVARNLALLVNDNTAAVGTRLLIITNDAKASGVGESILFQSTAADTNPLLELRNTNTSTSSPAILNFNRSSTTEEDDMGLGIIKFEGQNSGSLDTTYAQLEVIASDVTNNDEGGKMTFKLQSGGITGTAALHNLFSIGGEDQANSTQCAVVVNEDSIDCDFRIESTTNTSAFWINGDGSEVVINDTGQSDTDFRVESNVSDPEYPDDESHLLHDKTHAFFVHTSTGRVGLGTSAPDTTLHVAGSAHIEGDLWVKGVTNQIDTVVHVTSAMDITNSGTGPALKVTQTGTQPIAVFYDDAVPQLYLENGGNIGMSTATPISYDAEADNLVIKGLDHTGVTITCPDNKRGNIFFADGTKETPADTYRGGITYDHTDDDMSLRTNSTERIWIKNDGRVGIGKSDPDCDLYIKGYAGNGDDTQTALRLITTTSTGNTATVEIGQNDWGGQLVYDTTYDKFSIYTHHNDVAQTNGNDPEGTPRGMGGIHLRNDRGWVGIGSKRPMTSLYIDDTDGLRLPIGTTAQRPVTGATDITPSVEELYGTVRYNTEYLTFEGFGPGDTWGSLGGVIDIDRDTFWTALNDISGSNSYPGDPDCLRAFVGHNETGLNVNGTGDDEYNTSVPNGTQVMQIGLSSTWFDNDYTGGDGRYSVGIGVHVPTASLDVRGPDGPLTTANDGFVLRAAETEDWLTMGTDSSTRTSWIRAVRNVTGENDLTLQAGGGNVGIGTEAPMARLDVTNSANSETMPIALFNKDFTVGTGQKVALGFGLARNSGSVKVKSGHITVGKEQDWTLDDTHLDAYMAFSVLEGMVSKERVRIASDGNVGIGTASPVSPTSRDTALVVGSLVGTETSGLTLNHGSSFTNGPWEILTSSEGSSTRLAFNDGADPRMVISSAGKVGIGIISPDGPLHVASTHANTLTLTRNIDILGIANGASSKIEGGSLAGATPSNGAAIGFCLLDSDGTGVLENTKGYLYFETKDSGSSLSEKMRVTSEGHVGINCTNPETGLEVRGDASTYGRLTLSTAETTVVDGDVLGGVEFRAPKEASGTHAIRVGASIFAEAASTFSSTSNKTDLVFSVAGDAAATEGMRLHHTTKKLEVVGPIDGASLTLDNPLAVSEGGTGATTLDNLIALGTHTTGNYMNQITGGTGVSITHTQSEGSSGAIAIGQAVATTNNCQFAALGVGKANTGAGSIEATGDITAFAASSDISLKKDVTTIDNALDIVKGMRGVRFKWNDRAKELSSAAGDNVEVGVIAQEIGEILPEVIKDGVFEDTLAVKYEKITAVLIEAVKEQQSQIETLKEQVELLRRHL